MEYVVPAPVQPALAVRGGGAFPVRRIYCVGQNYAEHAVEMGSTGREAPFFFMKPADAVVPVPEGARGRMRYPSLTRNLHHEIELVIAIGRGGSDIAAADAMAHVWGCAVGLDMTRRDLQAEMKKSGRPWSIAKGFDEAAPIGALVPLAECGLRADAGISLQVDGQVRQASTLGKMIWSVPEILQHLSAAWTLAPGDLVFTGTPAGVGAVEPGQVLRGAIDGVGAFEIVIEPR